MTVYDTPTVAVFGDTGGHAQQLFPSLRALGVNIDTGYIPENLTIVHVGDLIHKGPHADDILEFLDKVFTHDDYSKRWVQLIGNHEAVHLDGISESRFATRLCDCSSYALDLLQSWYQAGHLQFATAITTSEPYYQGKDILVTHAGLTHGWWDILGSPKTGVEAVTAIRDEIRSVPHGRSPLLWNSGTMLSSAIPNFEAGILWAETIREVCDSWLQSGIDIPFHQFHGHSHPVFWEMYAHRLVWYPTVTTFWQEILVIDPILRTYTWSPSPRSGKIIGIDPSFTHQTPFIKEQPYTLLSPAHVFIPEGK